MRVAVVGATGNVGTSLLDALAVDDRIESVVGIARRLPTVTVPKATFRAADVAVDDLATLFHGADAVVHLAWLFQPTHRPMVTWRANAIGSIRVFEAVAAAHVPVLVHASSVGAYSPGPSSDFPVDESWPTHSTPHAGYGREKAYVERVLDAFELANPAVRCVRLRPGFVFKRSAATAQRRVFAGPFLPGRLLEPGRLPIFPHPPGLRFQALHSFDVADAYVRAVTTDVRGPFNVAAEPIIGPAELAGALGARPVEIPRRLVRAGVALAWHAHLTPADPALLDLVLNLPVMNISRARDELGWSPRHSALDALGELVGGMTSGAGGLTPPLAPDSPRLRVEEVRTGVGERP